MKKILTMMAMLLLMVVAYAQAPQSMTYQAVVRGSNNALVANQLVGVRISIWQGSATGSSVYVETHAVTTNANGLMTLAIGEGQQVTTAAFSDIDWADGPYFLKSEIDPAGGSNYSIEGVQQLLSVPYALYAGNAGNIPTVPTNVSAFVNDAGYLTDYTESQIISISNDTIYLTGGSFVKLPEHGSFI